jgi:pimeloyl-ACP methyl ester carboxylesterase
MVAAPVTTSGRADVAHPPMATRFLPSRTLYHFALLPAKGREQTIPITRCMGCRWVGTPVSTATERGVGQGASAGAVLCIYVVCITMLGMMSERVRPATILLLACVLSAACGVSSSATPTAPPPTYTLYPTSTTSRPRPTSTPMMTPTVTAVPELKRKVNVAGDRLYVHCMGAGTPAVIMEAGYNDVGETWSLVQPEVARYARACAYDRAGLGQSDPGPGARDSLDAVTALHALLNNAGIEGPYVLVGHSLGGEYVRLYAGRYPQDVAGLVLVDSAHPDQFQRSAAVLPPASPSDSESVQFYREWFTNATPDPTLRLELYAPGSLGDLPLVVLTAPDKQRADDVPAELNARLNRIWLEMQRELAQLSTNSRHVLSGESQHFIQQDEPELVIEAILWVLEEVSR